jgi:hypothetical protein
MKKLLIIAWMTFVLGLLGKLFHIPGANIISILGTFLLLLHSIIFLIKNFKTGLTEALFYLSYSSVTLYVLIRIMHWPAGIKILGFYTLFLLPFFICIAYFTRIREFSQWRKIPNILLLLYFFFFFQLSFTHGYKIYYFFNLNTVLNGPQKVIRPEIWDDYSWFLYKANNKMEALQANQNAIESARQIYNQPEEMEQLNATVQYLESNKVKLLTNTWEK